jgi:pantetheine-phosphate adenylyltransferase
VIIRGVRDSLDCLPESELAAMNEALGVTTLLMPARPELAAMSSTAMRALRAAQPGFIPIPQTASAK